jgi:hypothetical protein
MEMARDRYAHFSAIPGAVAKRAGPLVAVALNAANAEDAEALLAQVKYQAAVTVPETPAAKPLNFGTLLLNVVLFVLVVLGFCIASGVVVGGLRILLRRSGDSGDGDSMITLHLTGKP